MCTGKLHRHLMLDDLYDRLLSNRGIDFEKFQLLAPRFWLSTRSILNFLILYLKRPTVDHLEEIPIKST